MSATAVHPGKPTSFRPDEALKKAVSDYKRRNRRGSISEAICELIEAGLRAKVMESAAADTKKSLHEAMALLFPGWTGETVPSFGKPVKVAMKSGRDPISLILDRRKAKA
jgi:hypothetical protein